MKVGDLVTHVNEVCVGVGVVVDTYPDRNSCSVVWPGWGLESFFHPQRVLEVVSESR